MIHYTHNRTTSSHDAGVITLKEPLEWTEWVQPIALRPAGNSLPLRPGTPCVNTGWGSSAPDGISFPLPDVLQKVQLWTYPWETCKEAYAGDKDVDESMMCAGYPTEDGHGACSGDSGGIYGIFHTKRNFFLSNSLFVPRTPCMFRRWDHTTTGRYCFVGTSLAMWTS